MKKTIYFKKHLYENDDFVGYIYKITDKINNKIYVGQTKHPINSRLNGHIYASKTKTNNVPLQNAIRKYGAENFQIELIETCHSKQELNEREQFWIEKLNARDRNIGYNIYKGGECGPGGPMFAGHTHTEEAKQKMRDSHTGEKNAMYGVHRVMPEDEKMKHACPGEKNGMYGKQQSQESKEKNRQKHLGKKAYSNKKLDKVIMLSPEEGQQLIQADPDWTEGNVHAAKANK